MYKSSKLTDLTDRRVLHMSEKAVEYLSKQIENINNKLKEISDDIHCVDIEINTINDKITLIDNNTDKTEDMFISFGNEVFERNQNKLLKSKIDDLLKQKEIYQENYNQRTYKSEFYRSYTRLYIVCSR